MAKTRDSELSEAQRMYAEESRVAKAALRDFVSGAEAGDVQRMTASLGNLTNGDYAGGGWRRALRAVTRLGRVPKATQQGFLQVFLANGHTLREETDADFVLVDALRVLMPRYKGSGMTLYRGEAASNRRFRRYGSSWSSSRDVALRFAETGDYRCARGGSVLLVTRAPRLAIVCAPALLGDIYGEKEYVLDRRYLRTVNVEARFSQMSHEEYMALCRSLSDAK